MAIIKLQNEGESLTGNVTACEEVQGQYGAQVKFTFTTGDILFLPKESADRQLDRLGLDYDTAVGEALTFSRDHNPKKGSKPYWGISPAKAEKPAPSKRVQSPHAEATSPNAKLPLPFDEPPADLMQGAPLQGEEADPTPLDAKAEAERIQRDALTRAYGDLYEQMLATMSNAHHRLSAIVDRKESVPLDSMAVQAATATLWIAFDKLGLQRGIASHALHAAAEEG